MRNEPLLALRQTLLLALGLGACTTNPGPARAQGPTPRGHEPAAHGHVREPDGTVHRVSPETCSVDRQVTACSDDVPAEGFHECRVDADCTAGAHALCIEKFGQIGRFCGCDYSCQTDADCEADEACVCGDALGGDRHSQCVSAQCKVDAECASGTCGLSVYNDGCGDRIALACRGPGDACTRDADCTNNDRCVHDPAGGRWDCRGVSCVIGRPLLIDGLARTAPVVARGDWLTELDLPDDLPRIIKAALAAHWAEVAALEHASVASFAGFTLDLMSLGAPPDLLAEAQRAALDEIDHARIAWSLASLWSGRELGPGPLSLEGFPLRHGLEDIVRALVTTGCVGETLGAAEAQFCAELSTHPSMGPLLASIAHDEARHAAFAWRTLRWLLSTHGDDVRVVALIAFAEARAELAVDVPADDDLPAAPTWGLLRPSELLSHRRETFSAVIEPVLRAILGPTAQA